MVCYTPLRAYPGRELNGETGKRPMTFSGQKSLIEGTLYTVPCGVCIGCRIDRAEGWAIRGFHEARMHGLEPGSAFLTLTFEPDQLPVDNSVRLEVMQKFMRDLRYRVGNDNPLRYLLCGEYGERRGRAHYHVLVFGWRFPDRVRYKTTRNGSWLFTSEVLSKAWPYGLALLGDVTYQSARYVGGYVTKKIGGEKAEAHYTRQSPVDGNWYQVEPEFASMSLKPGLGESWFAKFSGDVFPLDHVIVDARPHKPPRYYEKLYGDEAMKPIKRKRKAQVAAMAAEEKSRQRRAVRERSAVLRSIRFERSVD